jgi:hypothetical protein
MAATTAKPAGGKRTSPSLGDRVLALPTGKTQQEITAACKGAREQGSQGLVANLAILDTFSEDEMIKTAARPLRTNRFWILAGYLADRERG